MNGLIFDIKRFAIHDGPGIRTTVFLKGCPLRCAWCHNPESQAAEPELSYVPDRCIGCGYCVKACPAGRHEIVDGAHLYDRDGCRRCGACAASCYAGALELIGREITVEEALAGVLRDRPFYETSGGGMTVSGGEPMAQPAFTAELLARARAEGLHTCLDTSGYAPFEEIARVLPSVDLIFYDVKETDPARHLDLTGVELAPILENLERIDAAGAMIVLRCPLVPGTNDRADHLRAVGALAERLDHVIEVNVLPYHPLGGSKRVRIGREGGDRAVSPGDDAVEGWINTIRDGTMVTVRRG